MKSILIHSELWSYVYGAKPRPENGAADRKIRKGTSNYRFVCQDFLVVARKELHTLLSAWGNI